MMNKDFDFSMLIEQDQVDNVRKSNFNDFFLQDNEIWLQKLALGNTFQLMVKCNVHQLIQEKSFMIILLYFLVI